MGSRIQTSRLETMFCMRLSLLEIIKKILLRRKKMEKWEDYVDIDWKFVKYKESYINGYEEKSADYKHCEDIQAFIQNTREHIYNNCTEEILFRDEVSTNNSFSNYSEEIYESISYFKAYKEETEFLNKKIIDYVEIDTLS